MLSTKDIGLSGIVDAFFGSGVSGLGPQPGCGSGSRGLDQAGFFLSADRGSFKMLVAKEVTAGFAFRIFEGRMITRGVGDRFSMAEDPAREQWTLR